MPKRSSPNPKAAIFLKIKEIHPHISEVTTYLQNNLTISCVFYIKISTFEFSIKQYIKNC